MNGLILSGTELLHCVELGYKAGEDKEVLFPVRASGLGKCPREVAAILAGASKREFSSRTLRIFERGHDRGEKLAEALRDGLIEHIMDLTDADWRNMDDDTKEQRRLDVVQRYEITTEVEVWCPLPVEGDEAEAIVSKTADWLRAAGVEGSEAMPLMVDSDGKLCVRGRIDVLIFDTEAREFWIVDFKTKNSWGFKSLPADGNSYGYEIQVLAYIAGMIHEDPEATCQGAFMYYEDHDRCDHMVVPVDHRDVGVLDKARDHIARALVGWEMGVSIEVAEATYTQSVHWKKKVHVKANGCLPWQCNYCSVGPIKGKCIDTDLFRLKDISKAGSEIPKFEVLDA